MILRSDKQDSLENRQTKFNFFEILCVSGDTQNQKSWNLVCQFSKQFFLTKPLVPSYTTFNIQRRTSGITFEQIL